MRKQLTARFTLRDRDWSRHASASKIRHFDGGSGEGLALRVSAAVVAIVVLISAGVPGQAEGSVQFDGVSAQYEIIATSRAYTEAISRPDRTPLSG